MIVFITALSFFAFVFYAVGFWSTNIYPALRPFRYNSGSDVHLPEARKTSLHATLASQYRLYDLVSGTMSDAEKVQRLTAWVHQLWLPHSGKSARSDNPLAILNRAQKGEPLGRSDYTVVLTHALMAINIPTRLVTLSTRDCAYRPYRCQHTGIEYFDRDHFKWVWLDEQLSLRILKDYIPLNIMEIKEAILNQHLLDCEPDNRHSDIDQYLAQISSFLDILIAQPTGQNRLYALIPPQLKIWRKKWGIGHRLFDVQCHSLASFYASHPIKQASKPDRPYTSHTVANITT